MTATLLDGNAMARSILEGVREEVAALGVPLQLAAVCASGDEALASFVRLKQRAALSVGIQFSSYFVDSPEHARETLAFLAADPTVHGMLLELPVPDGWDRTGLLSLIPQEKDVDVLSPSAEAAYERGESFVLPPPVVALRHVFDSLGIATKGVRAAVIGAGQLVGRPVAHWLRTTGAEVSVIEERTPEPERECSGADIVVSGAGSPGLVTGEWVREGAAVLDFGFHEGKGDVDAPSVIAKAGLLSPVPGGMGPLVVAAVLENLVELATR